MQLSFMITSARQHCFQAQFRVPCHCLPKKNTVFRFDFTSAAHAVHMVDLHIEYNPPTLHLNRTIRKLLSFYSPRNRVGRALR